LEFAIKQLKPEHKETIEAVYFRKLSIRGLAKVKYISKSGAEDRINRAIKALEKMIEP